VQNTWYGGELVVEHKKITDALEAQLDLQRYVYPSAAFETVKLPAQFKLTPELPLERVRANVLRVELPGIVTLHREVVLERSDSWEQIFEAHDLCFVSVLERHGKSGTQGRVAHGLLQNFGLKLGAVASSVGHDAHNLIIAGSSEDDMQVAVRRIEELRGGVVVVRDGVVLAEVALPISGLLSSKRARAVAEETSSLKRAWATLGCTLPYMGFNLLPLSVIPELRITDMGLVTVPGMEILPLFA